MAKFVEHVLCKNHGVDVCATPVPHLAFFWILLLIILYDNTREIPRA